MTYLGLCRFSSHVWYFTICSWMILLNRLCRFLGIDSGPLEIWICAKTAWVASDRLWLWLWREGYIPSGSPEAQ